jgi:predicted transcriptional regulator
MNPDAYDKGVNSMARTRQTPRIAAAKASRSPPEAIAPAEPYGERRPVTTKSITRHATSRGSPPTGDRSESSKLQEIVSVRFSDEELRRIQALAVIFETTPNAVIREACSFFISQKVGTPDYEQAIEAYHRRTSEVVDVLEKIKSAQ